MAEALGQRLEVMNFWLASRRIWGTLGGRSRQNVEQQLHVYLMYARSCCLFRRTTGCPRRQNSVGVESVYLAYYVRMVLMSM